MCENFKILNYFMYVNLYLHRTLNSRDGAQRGVEMLCPLSALNDGEDVMNVDRGHHINSGENLEEEINNAHRPNQLAELIDHVNKSPWNELISTVTSKCILF